MPLRASQWRSEEQGGSALIEFLLASFFLIFPLLLGTLVFGMSLVRANQVTEVCRDAGHMYAYSVDFSQTNNKNMLVQLAQGLNMTASGGNGVIILSTVTYVDQSDCDAAAPTVSNCANKNNTVFVRRIIIGNAGLHTSSFGTPNSSIVSSSGSISTYNYLSDTSARAIGFSNVIPLVSGQYAYMAEMFVVSPDFNLWSGNSFWSWISPGGISSRAIF